VRRAFYSLRPGGWRDYVTMLHLPYTAWNLSYVVIGGCLATVVSWDRLGLTVAAFFLALGIGAHTFDELAGRPLGTAIPSGVLVALGTVSLLAACAIGIAVAIGFSLWLLPLVAFGAFVVPAYNLELFGGRFHSDAWLTLAWGAFPVVTGSVACSGTLRAPALVAAAWAAVLILAQRRLSTPVRHVRRDVVAVSGELETASGDRETITREALVAGPESALRLLALSSVLIAAALVAFRISS
jgi:hypothetical protein